MSFYSGHGGVDLATFGTVYQKVREHLLPFRLLPSLVKAIWAAAPTYTALWCVTLIMRSVLPVIQLWVGKLLVDRLPLFLQHGPVAIPTVWPWALMLVGLGLFGTLLAYPSQVLEYVIRERVVIHLQRQLLERGASIPLADLERPEFFDRLQRANVTLNNQFVFIITWTVAVVFQLLSLGSLLVFFMLGPRVLFPILVVAALPAGVLRMRTTLYAWNVRRRQTPSERKMGYLSGLLTDPNLAKEIRLYNLGERLLAEREALRNKNWHEKFTVDKRQAAEAVIGDAANVLAYAVALIILIVVGSRGALSLGDYVVLSGALVQVQGHIGQLIVNLGMMHEGAVTTQDLWSFLSETRPERTGGLPFPSPLETGIVAEDLTFTYPGSEKRALDGVSFHIRPGERIAIVGTNGSGKSTLVKLLAGLYTPSAGTLRFDGVNVAEIDLASLREHVGTVSQNFVRYDLTARENIGFGRLDAMSDHGILAQAAQRGGGSEVAATLRDGLDTMLGKSFGGIDLSGGQWQKLAISRAFMRGLTGAEVLILDEPTSGLDPQAEADVFERFAQLTVGKTALLVSHRLGSARMADRIFLLSQGRLIEAGTHDELMRLGGEYARLFQMQAQWYQPAAK